jgi:pre-rRNA-processing protein IPI3
LLKKWHGDNTAVTCLVFSEDDSLLITGFKNGSIRVWSLLMYEILILSLHFFPPPIVFQFNIVEYGPNCGIRLAVLTIVENTKTLLFMSWFRIFDDVRRREASKIYEYSFSEHTLCVNDVVIGYGGYNAIIASASDDRTGKVCFTFFVAVFCRKMQRLSYDIYCCQILSSISTI